MAANRPRIPAATRRLTREEAARLNVSYSAKRRVRADIKRVTKRTRLYTDRQVNEAKFGSIREVRAAEHKARAHTEKLIVIRPGGSFVNVAVQGTDITKIRERNIAMAEARPRDGHLGNRAPLERFVRRYKRHYVTDVETGRRVDLIMTREELDSSKAQMNMPTRDEIDRRYTEDMAEV